jgi:hypothetical protein
VLESETLEDAINEVSEGSWFGNPKRDSWAIFDGDFSDEQDTPEGHTFTAIAVVHFQSV